MTEMNLERYTLTQSLTPLDRIRVTYSFLPHPSLPQCTSEEV